MTPLATWGIALVVLGIALATDLRWGKIHNWLTLPAIAAGLLLPLMPGTSAFVTGEAVLAKAIGLGVGILATVLPYRSGHLGGGAVKLVGAVGALVGYPAILPILSYAVLVGVVVVPAHVWFERRGRRLTWAATVPWQQVSISVVPPLLAGTLCALAVAAR